MATRVTPLNPIALGLSAGFLVGSFRSLLVWQQHRLVGAGLWQLALDMARAELWESMLIGAGIGLAWTLLRRLGIRRGTLLAAAAGLLPGTLAAWAGLSLYRYMMDWTELGATLRGLPSMAKLAIMAAVALAGISLLALFVMKVFPRWRVKANAPEAEPRLNRSADLLGARWILGVGMLALALLLGLEARSRFLASGPPDAPNLILITIDTLRADHLGCYGNERPTSPHIDRLAESGVLFQSAISQAPWTLPSMASVHTSLYPSQHGATRSNRRLPPDIHTVAEVLRDAGYHTVGVVSHVFTSEKYGFRQGFQKFDESAVLGHDGVSSELLTKAALENLGPNPPEPFFLWVHYFDPHYTYVDHEAYDFADTRAAGLPGEIEGAFLTEQCEALTESQVRVVKAVYDEEIALTDHSIGELLSGVDALGLSAPTATVVTADHGEYFRERGRFGHGKDVYRELVNVPLIVSGPVELVGSPRVVEAPVETASVAPTLVGLAGLPETLFRGVDLLGPIPAEGNEALAFAEGGYAWGSDSKKVGVVSSEGWKLIHNLDDDTRELYDLEADPDELQNLAGSGGAAADVEERLDERLSVFGGGEIRASDELQLDAAEIEHLRALGYVE